MRGSSRGRASPRHRPRGRVAVTESKELEFSVDCGDDGALHLRAADADELELWVTSLGEVVEANAHAANGSQRRAPELAAAF